MARVAPRAGGFSLVELLIALLLGGVVAATLVQALLGESRAAQTLGRLLRDMDRRERAPRRKSVSAPDFTKVPVPTSWPSKDKALVKAMSVVGAV